MLAQPRWRPPDRSRRLGEPERAGEQRHAAQPLHHLLALRRFEHLVHAPDPGGAFGGKQAPFSTGSIARMLERDGFVDDLVERLNRPMGDRDAQL